MNDLPQKYNPADVEDKWYAYWLENKLFLEQKAFNSNQRFDEQGFEGRIV